MLRGRGRAARSRRLSLRPSGKTGPMVRRASSLAALLLLVALVAGGCGSSSKKDSASTTTTTKKPGVSVQTVPTTAPPKVPSSFTGGNKATFCTEWSNLLAASSGTPTESNAIRTKYNKVVEIARRVLAAASDEIKSDIETAIRIAKEAADTGSLKPFDSDESKKVGSRIAAYTTKQCTATTTTTAK